MQIFARLSKILSDVMGTEDMEYPIEDSMSLLTSNAGLTAEDRTVTETAVRKGRQCSVYLLFRTSERRRCLQDTSEHT